MKIISLVLLITTIGCESVRNMSHTPESYFVCTEVDTTTRVYTFKRVYEPRGYTTIIKARPAGIYVGKSDFMQTINFMPTYCWPGKRWNPDQWDRPNELYFRVKNTTEDKAEWTAQFDVLSEAIEAPKINSSK